MAGHTPSVSRPTTSDPGRDTAVPRSLGRPPLRLALRAALSGSLAPQTPPCLGQRTTSLGSIGSGVRKRHLYGGHRSVSRACARRDNDAPSRVRDRSAHDGTQSATDHSTCDLADAPFLRGRRVDQRESVGTRRQQCVFPDRGLGRLDLARAVPRACRQAQREESRSEPSPGHTAGHQLGGLKRPSNANPLRLHFLLQRQHFCVGRVGHVAHVKATKLAVAPPFVAPHRRPISLARRSDRQLMGSTHRTAQ